MMRVYVNGLGLWGDGLSGWTSARNILGGGAPYVPSPVLLPECERLPAAERRRAVNSVKLALVAGNEAAMSADHDPATLETSFASSAGDCLTLHGILEALAAPERQVSPTRFHNSVHNAAAGYWHIATKSREASTSVCCHDESFSGGLVDSVSRIATGSRSMLLVAYDLPYPAPLDKVRPIVSSFGAAFALSAKPTERSVASMDIDLGARSLNATRMIDPLLERLRAGNPAARSLPLLAALARHQPETIILDYVAGNRLTVAINPINSIRSTGA